MTKIVTHPGTAHGDDFLACCVLLSKFPEALIERRNPTQDDLDDDQETFVLDQGGKYEPAMLNFDHHQNIEIPCSFNLILKHLKLLEKFRRAFRWFDNIDFRDRNGVKKLGKRYGLDDEQMAELGSPVHTSLMKQFGEREALSPFLHNYGGIEDDIWQGMILHETMRKIGLDLIETANKYNNAWEKLSESNQYDVDGKKVLVYESDDYTATNDFARENKIAVMVSHDNRGDGWAILRVNDEPGVNFYGLAEKEQVLFAHKAGFVFKTKQRIPVDDLIELIEKGIR